MATVKATWRSARAEVSLSGTTAGESDLAAGMALHAKLDRAVASLMPGIEEILDTVATHSTFARPEGDALQSVVSGELTLRFAIDPPLGDEELRVVRECLDDLQRKA